MIIAIVIKPLCYNFLKSWLLKCLQSNGYKLAVQIDIILDIHIANICRWLAHLYMAVRAN